VASEAKFVPFTVSVTPAEPTKAPEGESELTWGMGLSPGLMVNVSVVLVPPPGWGVVTTTRAEPAFWMSIERICALRLVVLLKTVVRGKPFHKTVEAGVKFFPATVKLNPG